jgi:hypothetical protein
MVYAKSVDNSDMGTNLRDHRKVLDIVSGSGK